VNVLMLAVFGIGCVYLGWILHAIAKEIAELRRLPKDGER
jgi:hypothetical protein